ncbi:MAG TPA: SCO family protein [Hanamia sp.]|nr:SCO family protein [Hanamia sp.]
MKKKAFIAILVAILLPVTGFLLVSYYSNNAIQMPHRYFYDSVNVVNKDGRTTFDTAWHHVSNLHGINQMGQHVSLDDLKGKIIVLDFFFTHCPSLCPRLAVAMKKLQNSFPNQDSIVQFLSISIDPQHDSVTQLRNWAKKFNVDPDSWWLLTGNRDSIYNFALHEVKASVADVGIDTAFIHSSKFFLLDKHRVVRGWFDGLDTVAQARLVRDIPLLMLEKDQKKSFWTFFKGLLKGNTTNQ